MEKKSRNLDNRYDYIQEDWRMVQDRDGRWRVLQMWDEWDGKTGEFIQYVLIFATTSDDTPYTVDWDFHTDDPETAWRYFCDDQYRKSMI